MIRFIVLIFAIIAGSMMVNSLIPEGNNRLPEGATTVTKLSPELPLPGIFEVREFSVSPNRDQDLLASKTKYHIPIKPGMKIKILSDHYDAVNGRFRMVRVKFLEGEYQGMNGALYACFIDEGKFR